MKNIFSKLFVSKAHAPIAQKKHLDATTYLPIGSIVLLKDSDKRLMVFGIDQSVGKEQYDYVGVPYPEGYISEEYTFLFNHDSIAQVFFKGYEDAERQKFVDSLSEIYERF